MGNVQYYFCTLLNPAAIVWGKYLSILLQGKLIHFPKMMYEQVGKDAMNSQLDRGKYIFL